MSHSWAPKIAVALLLTLASSSCQTRQPVEPTTAERVPAGAPIYFHPANAQAPIMFESGRYPTLFAGNSHATWIEPVAPAAPAASAVKEVSVAAPGQPSLEAMENDPKQLSEAVPPSAEEQEARALATNFNVVYCDMASVFMDSAIAYDVVGLRNVQAYLLTPEGKRLEPVQRMINSQLDEQPQGALKKYRRSIVLLFPKEPEPIATPLAGARPPGMRLMLEGYGSKFYFEWPAQIPVEIGAPPLGEREWVKKGEKTYRGVRTKERAVIHKFD